MATVSDLLTMKYLYSPNKDNPYERQAKLIGRLLQESGFAKPFLAYAMGKNLAQAQDYESKEEEAKNKLLDRALAEADAEKLSLKEKQRVEMLSKVFTTAKSALDMGSPELAVEIINGFSDVTGMKPITSIKREGKMLQFSVSNGRFYSLWQESPDKLPTIYVYKPEQGTNEDGSPKGKWVAAAKEDLDELRQDETDKKKEDAYSVYLRNRVDELKKKGLSENEARAKATREFFEMQHDKGKEKSEKQSDFATAYKIWKAEQEAQGKPADMDTFVTKWKDPGGETIRKIMEEKSGGNKVVTPQDIANTYKTPEAVREAYIKTLRLMGYK